MSDEERESDLGEWCSEHREFYTEGTPCPGCKVIREAYIRGAKDALRETVEIVLDKRFAYLVIAQAGVESVAALLENRIDRGEWRRSGSWSISVT